MEENPVLADLMSQYTALTADFNILRLVTPKNQHEQMCSWLDAAERWDYKNPYFIYDEAYISQIAARKDKLKRLRALLLGTDIASFSPSDRAVVEILKNRTDSAIITTEFAEAMLAKRDGQAGEILRKKFGQLSRRTVSRANEFLSLMKEARDNPHRQDASKKILTGKDPLFTDEQITMLKGRKVSPEEIVKIVERELKENGYDGFRVVANPKAARVRVCSYSSKGPYVVVPTRHALPAFYVAQVVGREIDCRVRLLANGAEVLRGMGSGAFLPDDLSIYEGIDAKYEIEFNCQALGKTTKMPSPWEILAINELQKGRSFGEVGKYIFDLRIETISDYQQARKDAWNATFQVLKGCCNPNHPERYAFFAARQRFDGFHAITEYTYDKRVAPWLNLGVFDIDDIHYLKQHIREVPTPKHAVGNLSEKIARSFLAH